ncbi:MAG TPA: hypothetical protein VEB23_10075 [Ramlibacter sp.]|nr:hypothetical protein [Ramlibacter sp.]
MKTGLTIHITETCSVFLPDAPRGHTNPAAKRAKAQPRRSAGMRRVVLRNLGRKGEPRA